MSCIYDDIYSNFINQVKVATTEIIFVSAFITSNIVRHVYNEIDRNVKLTFICRYSKQDLIYGSSDLESARIIMQNNGRILRNPNLHAKLFMFDKKLLLFGSANLTNRGLGLSDKSNIECVSQPEPVASKDIFFVNSLIESSQVVDDQILIELEKQLEVTNTKDFDEQIIDEISSKLDGIFIGDFPYACSPQQLIKVKDDPNSVHDLQLLKIDASEYDLNIIKNRFEKTKISQWLDSIIVNNIRFGELSALIHNSLLDDPKPYRKDIKELQQNLFTWINELLIDKYQIYIPDGGHSQIISKILIK